MHLNFGKLPVVVQPQTYELPLLFWRWCKLNEVCAIIPGLAELGRIGEFHPTPEELVSRFAALVRPNKLPYPAGVETDEVLKKKIFRYSLSGNGIEGREVPTKDGEDPPYKPFILFPSYCFPSEMFVPEGWVIDTLKAIRRGAVAAADFGGFRAGFKKDGTPFVLDGDRTERSLVKIPVDI